MPVFHLSALPDDLSVFSSSFYHFQDLLHRLLDPESAFNGPEIHLKSLTDMQA